MISTTFDCWTLSVNDGRRPGIYNHYVAEATFVDDADITLPDGRALFVAIADGQPAWPQICISLRYDGGRGIFHPGFLIVPETALLFIGAGEGLRCYDLHEKRRLWTDHTDCGFWGWARHGAHVVMSAELEFAVWSMQGDKLWSEFVEPPWSYTIDGDFVRWTSWVMSGRAAYSMEPYRVNRFESAQNLHACARWPARCAPNSEPQEKRKRDRDGFRRRARSAGKGRIVAGWRYGTAALAAWWIAD